MGAIEGMDGGIGERGFLFRCLVAMEGFELMIVATYIDFYGEAHLQ